MSCSINRYKISGAKETKAPNTAAAKEMEARMKEMLEVRAAQDHGDFKFRPGFSSSVTGEALESFRIQSHVKTGQQYKQSQHPSHS